jgi:hypothetical protein
MEGSPLYGANINMKTIDDAIRDLMEFKYTYGGNVILAINKGVVMGRDEIVWQWKPVEDIFYDQENQEIRLG